METPVIAISDRRRSERATETSLRAGALKDDP